MKNRNLTFINKTTDSLYDDVDSISEELVDGNKEEVINLINSLSLKLKDLKSSVQNNEI